jgi:hypothetical protein
MSLVLSILLVVGLFTVLGLVAWGAVTHALTSPQGALSRPSLFDASPAKSHEVVGHYAG